MANGIRSFKSNCLMRSSSLMPIMTLTPMPMPMTRGRTFFTRMFCATSDGRSTPVNFISRKSLSYEAEK